MTQLIKYEAARLALAEAKAVDEAKDIRDRAEAMRIYGMQAKNKDLEIDAAEIRIRAERRLGELIYAQKEAVGLNEGGRPITGADAEPVMADHRPTLAQAGIDKKLSSRAQKIAAVPAKEFEDQVEQWRERVRAEGERVTVNLEKAGERILSGAAAAEREQKKADEISKLKARIAELEVELAEEREKKQAVIDELEAYIAAEKDPDEQQVLFHQQAIRIRTLESQVREHQETANQWKRETKALRRKYEGRS